MPAPRLSVIVVSWARPRALARCLIALSQLRSTWFEVVVVADEDGLAVARALPFSERITFLEQKVGNISAARNQGIAAAAGEIVAFVDDDAVAEPDWAETILSAFGDPDLAAVTGPVIGRNGISLQWGRMAVDRLGRDRWLAAGEAPGPGETVKLHGTNMAFRREILALNGGFDPVFRFYLDETDLARRLVQAGQSLRHVPGMRVHHGFAKSPRRRADRIPTDLTDIGASSMIFLKKHAPDALEGAVDHLIEDQRLRLMRLARARKIGPTEIRHLTQSLRSGIDEGRTRDLPSVVAIPATSRSFVPLRDDLPPPMSFHDGWWHKAKALRAQAADQVAQGRPTALVLLEPTPRKHRIVFTDGGWWEQSGGLFGPSDRTERRVQLWRYRDRIAHEKARLFAPGD